MDDKVNFLSDKQLLKVLSTSADATAIHVSEKAVIQYANNAMLAFWDKGDSVIGKSLEDALPELKGQPFIDLFKKVWNEGITVSGTDTPADLVVEGELRTFYFDYEYRAVKNEQGETICILHTAKDVTERKLSREREQNLTEELMAANEELVAANEEITATNEEMAAINEELTASNEEIAESRQQLAELYKSLSESDAFFRSMVKQAPVGICIIQTENLFVQEVNDAYLELVGKPRELFHNRTIWESVPEAAAVYQPIMDNVITSGIPFVAKEHELILIRNGVAETVFVDFVYEPMNIDGNVQAIMVLAIEVTDKVIARRGIEDVEERIRLAIEAAEIGTFDLNMLTGNVLTSERFDHIFGFSNGLDWKMYRDAIYQDDKIIRDAAHKNALVDGKLFYEVRITHPDSSIHWVRVQGNVYFANDNKPVRMLGTVLDITVVKRLEQQKDDFISIASHELKTPITSLKASLQLLDKLKKDETDSVSAKLIQQSLKSMAKINTLVGDLLNVNRTQQNQLLLNKSVFTINDMIEGCCGHIRTAGKYKLIIQGDKELKVYADEHAIDQVMVNFVNNAVKYAPDSLEIFMIIENLGDRAKISVKDAGPGIAKEKLSHLFERYYQAQPGGFNSSGLGLGLYISSEIVRRHGGEIGVDSKLGEGSTFWITLPLAGNDS